MEPVLRSVELAANLSNNTDLDALLASRLDGGHLPEPDLRGPHPFRGSAPGVQSNLRGCALSPSSPLLASLRTDNAVRDLAAQCVLLSQQCCTHYLPASRDLAS